MHLCQLKESMCPGEGRPCTVPGQKGICAQGVTVCQGAGLGCKQTTQPKEKEVCGNKLDDNCDGTIDETTVCSCTPGNTRPCFPDTAKGCTSDGNEPPTFACKGACKAGKQVCRPDFTWGACDGFTAVSSEKCDGIDNDCNGQIDEDFPGKGDPCGILGKKGPCARGKRVCLNGDFECESTFQPLPQDKCDNTIDDNCDGIVNEPPCKCTPGQELDCYNGLPETKGKGECKGGKLKCQPDGSLGQCVGEVNPTTEVCDGKDNNCDGNVDETFPGKGDPCTDAARKGECKVGINGCTNGKPICTATVLPKAETCNQKDDDCDGQVDNLANGKKCACTNGASQNCYTGPSGTEGKGICKGGKQTCQNGEWGTCVGEQTPQTETCGNSPALDENCDGNVNEQPFCQCTAGNTQKCGTDKGECTQGSQTCDAQGSWGACTGGVAATTEVCDGKDNDCDGQIDEDFTNLRQACKKGAGECEATGTFVCDPTNNKQTVCNATPGTPSTDFCDGKDNDCDGTIDNTPGTTTPMKRACYPTTASGCTFKSGKYTCTGTCTTGIAECVNGSFSTTCTGAVTPQPDLTKDGKDQDCDGTDGPPVPVSACADGSDDQKWASGNMVGCDCVSSPCNPTTAASLCNAAAGWRICNVTKWKANFGNVYSTKMRFVAAKVSCTASTKDFCPCRNSGEAGTGPNTSHVCGTTGGPTLADATSLCEQSCTAGSGFGTGYWTFFAGPQAAETLGSADYCGGRWSSWTGGAKGIVGRGTHIKLSDFSKQTACQSTQAVVAPNTYGEGVMCCK